MPEISSRPGPRYQDMHPTHANIPRVLVKAYLKIWPFENLKSIRSGTDAGVRCLREKVLEVEAWNYHWFGIFMLNQPKVSWQFAHVGTTCCRMLMLWLRSCGLVAMRTTTTTIWILVLRPGTIGNLAETAASGIPPQATGYNTRTCAEACDMLSLVDRNWGRKKVLDKWS